MGKCHQRDGINFTVPDPQCSCRWGYKFASGASENFFFTCRHVVLLISCHEFMYPSDPHGVKKKKWGDMTPQLLWVCRP